MKHARAGILSVRAVNEYRRRDTLAYLGLRLYLDNAAACTDDWAQEVAVNSILRRSNPIYFRTSHFKEMSGGGSPEHRSIFLPSATEALAEAVLLRECSRRGRAFRNPPVAFSYRLKGGDDRRGLFEHYMRGIRDRQHRISDACEGCPDGVVRYADIRKFYPSISTELAAKAWHTCSESGQLPIQFRNLGEKLIVDQSRVLGVESRGILTGPMFSHLLGNLVLRRIDEEFGANPLVKYFRYVDDIILVGERDAVRLSLEALRNRLAEQQLELHDDESPKSYGVSTGDWLEGRRDFDQNVRADSWPSLICDLKHFLLVNPDLTGALQLAFRAESFRLPVRDYSNLAGERISVARLLQYGWEFRRWWRTGRPSVQTLIGKARYLRNMCEQQFYDLLKGAAGLQEYARKRRITKLRYNARRLIYLAADANLLQLASAADGLPELYQEARIMEAVASGRIDRLLPLGTNAAQATAQPLAATGRRCHVGIEIQPNTVEDLALAVFLFNGVPVDWPERLSRPQSEIGRFAALGSDMELMRSNDPYVREIACLHGLRQGPRHAELLRAAFDRDEQLVLDAIDQFQRSAYY